MRPKLITIPISHYGERARWALDHAEIDYDEEHHVQVFSWLAAYRAGGRRFLPVLVTDEGVLDDSAAIVRFASERSAAPLYPAEGDARDAVIRWEERFAGAFGVETRRVCYEWTFRVLHAVLPYNAGAAPGYEVAALALTRSLARAFMRRYLGTSAEQAARGREITLETMDAVAEAIADGRPYLIGDRFTAADLTFAAMSAPALLPEGYGVPLPPLSAAPEDAAAWIRTLRAHPAGAFAQRMYRERPAPRGALARPTRVARLLQAVSPPTRSG